MLFVCDECHGVDNTALGRYWTRDFGYYHDDVDSKALCTECAPKRLKNGKKSRYNGRWHNRFKKVIATPEVIKLIGRNAFVYISDIKYEEK